MKQTSNPIIFRIQWCRRQSAQARTEPEADEWHAEEDGLRDALMNSDHTNDYRLCPPEILRRYVLGFEDGTALLRAARVEHELRACHIETIPMEQDVLQGGTR
jgi:hypothetical protein